MSEFRLFFRRSGRLSPHRRPSRRPKARWARLAQSRPRRGRRRKPACRAWRRSIRGRKPDKIQRTKQALALDRRSCACHRRLGQAFPLLNDFTLRKADSIMTPSGIVVFRGVGHSPYAQDDFATLANASISRDRRAVLAVIERAALPNIRQSSEAPSPPRNCEIAFAAPSPNRSTAAPPEKSIRFVGPMIAANN